MPLDNSSDLGEGDNQGWDLADFVHFSISQDGVVNGLVPLGLQQRSGLGALTLEMELT